MNIVLTVIILFGVYLLGVHNALNGIRRKAAQHGCMHIDNRTGDWVWDKGAG